MSPNPYLKALGYQETDRLVILHADDIGMCQATLDAYAGLLDTGLPFTAATMVPCPWFPALADLCASRPEGIDMGVHLTLTSEWAGYRWGPLSTHDPATGLLNADGYFPAANAPVHRADPAAVAKELADQVDRALAAGIDVTHIDSHMGTVFHPNFIEGYLSAGLRHGIPAMFPRLDEAGMRAHGIEGKEAQRLTALLDQLAAQGLPILDDLKTVPLDQHEGRLESTLALLESVEPGITYFILHPAVDTPELRAITPHWQARVGDYEAFTSDALRRYLEESDLHIIQYRALRDAMRAGARS
ncbi:MAG: polysaccharide deacetylase family protein [Anaerolineae bacterium]